MVVADALAAVTVCTIVCVAWVDLFVTCASAGTSGHQSDCTGHSYARTIFSPLGSGYYWEPMGVTLDVNGNILVSDVWETRINKYAPNGTCVGLFGDYGTFDKPSGMATDCDGNIYVVDDSSVIKKLAPTGELLGTIGGFELILNVDVDGRGNVYTADNANHSVHKIAANGTPSISFGTFGSDNGLFNRPFGASADSAGNIYVADGDNHRIQKFAANGTYLATFGGYGQQGGQFNGPRAVVPDNAGHIYVADQYNHRIQKLDANNGTFISSFEGGWGTDASPLPIGMHLAQSGSLYVVTRYGVVELSCTSHA